MATNPTSNSYLSKIIALLIRKGGGTIRIPAQDLYEDDIGSGFQVHFDYQTKELVLTHVPAGARIFEIKEQTSWLTPENSLPLNNGPRNLLSESKKPLTPDQLISRVWTDSAGTPTLEEIARLKEQKENKVRVLTTEGMAEAELRRREEQVVREITDYQSPQPAYRPPSQRGREPGFSPPLTTFSKR